MPTLLCRSNGVYYVVSSQRGRRVWQSLKTRDRATAESLYTEFQEKAQGRQALRLSCLLQDFTQRKALYVQQTTIDLYRASFANFIRHCGDRPTRSVSVRDVDRFMALRVKEVKPVTVNIDLRLLRAVFNDALRMKLIKENPFNLVKLLPRSDVEGVYLTESEVRRLLMVIRDLELKHLVLFVVLTMLRRGELINVEWADIDFQRHLIHIRNKPGFKVKGGKPRAVPMNDWVYQYLQEKTRTSRYIFSNTKGYPLSGSWISHTFKKAIRQAELDDRVHFHSLRHTGISMLINRGVPPAFVQKLAGHSSPLTTAIYTHIEDQSLRSAVSSFPSLN